jgi:predicted dinucleotide-binding enzyme
MVARLSVPWEALLATLESVRGDKIIVESLRPDLAGRKVEITAQAPGFGEVAGFVERLNASKTLRQAVLVSEATTRDSSIRFVVTATWSETQ